MNDMQFEKERQMGGLVISRDAYRAISARRRTTAHITIVSSVFCNGYVVNKTVSYNVYIFLYWLWSQGILY
jgi:hypothetical protein